MPASLSAALVGTGFIGPVHVEALRRLGVPVVGVFGSTPQRGRQAAERLGIPKAYDRYDDLLADPAVQVVHITSPNRHHFEQARLALAAGKHLVCEKPLAITAQESAELARLARAVPLTAAVCYNIRFYPLCLEAHARIHAGEVGELYHVNGSYVQDWLLHDTDFNWRVLASEGGALRAVADIGTHWLDLVTWIIGQPVRQVCADLQTVLPVRRRPKGSVETFAGQAGTPAETEPIVIDTEDCGTLLLRFDRGQGACLVSQVSAGRKNCLRFEIAGSKASLAWNSERPNEMWIGRRDQPSELLIRDPALLDESARRFADYPGGHSEGFPDTFKQLFRAIYDYIAAGDPRAPRPFPTFDDGHREVALCEAILRSHRERRWIEVETPTSGL